MRSIASCWTATVGVREWTAPGKLLGVGNAFLDDGTRGVRAFGVGAFACESRGRRLTSSAPMPGYSDLCRWSPQPLQDDVKRARSRVQPLRRRILSLRSRNFIHRVARTGVI